MAANQSRIHIIPFLIIYLLGYYFMIAFLEGHAVSVIFLLEVVGFLYVFFHLLQAHREQDKGNKIFIRIIGAGMISYFIGDLIWFISFRADKTETFLLWYNLFLSGAPFFVLSAFLYKMYKINKVSFVFILLDMMIVISILAAFMWHYFMGPVLESLTLPIMTQLLSYHYQAVDIGLVFSLIAVSIYFRNDFPRKMILWFAAGLLFYLAGEVGYVLQVSEGPYSTKSIIQPFWITSFLLMAQSTMYLRSSGENVEFRGRFSVHLITLLIGYLLAGSFILIVGINNQSDEAMIGLYVTVILLMIRHVVTLYQNMHLINKLQQMNRYLEKEVGKRTLEISKKNEELEQALQQIKYLAYHDSLTGLMNRRAFETAVQEKLSGSHAQHAIVFLDLNYFKKVNDTYGHYCGDLLITEFGKRLEKNVGQTGIVTRFAGDEFVLFLENYNRSKVDAFVKMLIVDLTKPYQLENGQELCVSSSIGISLYPDNGTELVDLINKADMAMLQIKSCRSELCYAFYIPS